MTTEAMMTEAIVVMESGSRWPGWIDEQNGPDSSVQVLAQRRDETYAGFGMRASRRVRDIARCSAVHQALLVCNREGGAARLASRRTLLRALLYEMQAAGGGKVVVVLDGTAAQRRDLAHVVAGLSDELDAEDALTLHIRALPSQPPPSLRQVA